MRKLTAALAAIGTILAAIVYALLNRVDTLKNAVARKEAEKDLAVTLTKLDDSKKGADDAEATYAAARADFIKQRDSK